MDDPASILKPVVIALAHRSDIESSCGQQGDSGPGLLHPSLWPLVPCQRSTRLAGRMGEASVKVLYIMHTDLSNQH